MNTVDTRIPVGICPVFGIMSGDNNRAFILNRGSNDVTVINVPQNAIDPHTPDAHAGHGRGAGLGPVHAAIYQPAGLLVTANYDSNTITVINVGLDIYGNDGPNFGEDAHHSGRQRTGCGDDPAGWIARVRGKPVRQHAYRW